MHVEMVKLNVNKKINLILRKYIKEVIFQFIGIQKAVLNFNESVHLSTNLWNAENIRVSQRKVSQWFFYNISTSPEVFTWIGGMWANKEPSWGTKISLPHLLTYGHSSSRTGNILTDWYFCEVLKNKITYSLLFEDTSG